MNGMGIVDHSAFLCDSCGKRIPTKGVRMNMEEQGEYQVSYFTCPHCGRVSQITTTELPARDREKVQKATPKAGEEFGEEGGEPEGHRGRDPAPGKGRRSR